MEIRSASAEPPGSMDNLHYNEIFARKRGEAAVRVVRFAVAVMAAALALVVLVVAVRALTAPDADASAVGNYRAGADVSVKTEEFWGGGERHVRVLNTGKTTVFVRVTPYYKVTDPSGALRDAVVSDGAVLTVNTSSWIRRGGSYYCLTPVPPGKYTPFFIESCASSLPDGFALDISFVLRAVPADDLASLSSWGLRVSSSGTLEIDDD